MADAWDDEEYEPPPVVVAAPAKPADATAFEDEEDEDTGPAHAVPQTVEKKEKKKIGAGKGEPSTSVKDETLADPVAEKLRRQKLVEEADFKNAQELFSDTRNPEDLSPASVAEFEDYGRLVASKLLRKYEKSAFYPALLRALLKSALSASSSGDVKEVETTVVNLRNDRLKSEKEKDGKSKKTASKKRFVNAGAGGGAGGDLDDARFYGQALDTDGAGGDDFDFM